MASIDKIYGTQAQYEEFSAWVSANKPEYLKHFYDREGYNPKDRPITNFPESADRWLLENCPIVFVVERIREQYGMEDGENWPEED